MNGIKLIFSVLFVFTLISCTTTYETKGSAAEKSPFTINSSPTFKGYFYHGSDNQFHYFVGKWDWQKDHHFKLAKQDLKIDKPFEFELQELRIDLFKTDEKFGGNEFFDLYIME